jgi:putative ABC transport system ATP-binding protein
MKTIILAKQLKKTYYRGNVPVEALRGVDLTVNEGEFVSLMGPSGCGKTTLLNIIGGIDKLTSGSLEIDGTNINMLSSNKLAKWRSKNVGFVFQTYNLMPVLNALENVELPLILTEPSKKKRRKRALKMLDKVGLSERIHHRPTEMSGGQQQRVAIARALAGNPKLIIADEPTGDLDSESGKQIMALLKEVCRNEVKTIILVTHDSTVAKCGHIIRFLRDGVFVGEQLNDSK